MAIVTAGVLGALGALGSTVASPKTAHAWIDGKPYAMGFIFDHNIVNYFIDPATIPAWENDNIQHTANAWTAVDSNLFFVPGGSSRTTTDVQIYGYTNNDNASGWGGCNNVGSVCPARSGAGFVKLYFDGNTTAPTNGGHASYSDTPTNDQSIVGQEQGHSFGLDHSCLDNQLMSGPNQKYVCGHYAPYCPEPTCINSPQADDQAGDIALYGRYTPPPAPPCQSVLCRINQPAPPYNPVPPSKLDVLRQILSYPAGQQPLNTTAGMGW